MATLRKITLNWEIRTGAITCDTGYIKRQELCDVDLYVTVDGTPYALDTSWAINLSIKPALLGDNAALVAVTTWTASATTGLYQATAQTIGGTALDTYLAANNADTTDDEGNKLVDLDVYYTVSMAMKAKSDTVTVICKPDVGRTDDTVPAAIVARNDFLVTNGTGLLVNVAAGYAANGAFVAAQASLAITNATNYIEVTAAGVASVNTTAFSAGSYPLATVVASAGAITANTDLRAWITPKPSTATALTVGTTAIASGTSGRILYDNAGVLGELPVGTGVATALGITANTTGGVLTTIASVVKSNGVTSIFYTPTANTAAARGVALAAAIAASASGDSINIGPGTFDGSFTLPTGVMLRGAGEQFTLINGTITRPDKDQHYNIADLRTSDGVHPVQSSQLLQITQPSGFWGTYYNAAHWNYNATYNPATQAWVRATNGLPCAQIGLEQMYNPFDAGTPQFELNIDLAPTGSGVPAFARFVSMESTYDLSSASVTFKAGLGNTGPYAVFRNTANTAGFEFWPNIATTTPNTAGCPFFRLGVVAAEGVSINSGNQGSRAEICTILGSGLILGDGTSAHRTYLDATATGTLRVSTNGSTLGTVEAATGTFTTLTASATTSLLLGTAGSAVGNVGFRNATSGTTTLAPATGALGTGTVTLPLSGTLAISSGAQTFTGVQSMTSPDITTSITTPSTTFALVNATATTVNFAGGASTALNMGNASGTNTVLGANVLSTAGAASKPVLKVSGVPFAGTGTTSFPLVYINDANATASTTLNTAGTYFGVNGDGTQDLMNLMKDGVSQFKVSSAGAATLVGNLLTTSAANANIGDSTNYYLRVYTDGVSFRNLVLRYSTPSNGIAIYTDQKIMAASFYIGGGNSVSEILLTGTTTLAVRNGNNSADAAISASNGTLSGTLAVTGATTLTGLLTANGGITLGDAQNIAFNATTGTKIGAATTQKLSFWNATPIVQPTTAVASATFASPGGGANMKTDDTFDGYTIAQVVKALRNAGLLA
jgi:hypothetical protein